MRARSERWRFLRTSVVLLPDRHKSLSPQAQVPVTTDTNCHAEHKCLSERRESWKTKSIVKPSKETVRNRQIFLLFALLFISNNQNTRKRMKRPALMPVNLALKISWNSFFRTGLQMRHHPTRICLMECFFSEYSKIKKFTGILEKNRRTKGQIRFFILLSFCPLRFLQE